MDFRDDAPPWSFFIPVTLAVIVGVLAADAIRFAIGTVFDGNEAGQVAPPPSSAADAHAQARAEAAANAAAEAAAVREAGQPDSGAAPARGSPAAQIESDDPPGSAAAATGFEEAPAPEEASQAGGVLELPDSMTARREGEPAACVNGTVVHRVEGGWEQALEHDAPIACVTVHR